jgi:hypothetical protein
MDDDLEDVRRELHAVVAILGAVNIILEEHLACREAAKGKAPKRRRRAGGRNPTHDDSTERL